MKVKTNCQKLQIPNILGMKNKDGQEFDAKEVGWIQKIKNEI